MDQLTLAQIFDLISSGGMLGILIVILFTGARGNWVWGWTYKETLKERDEWKDIALTGARIAERATITAVETRSLPKETSVK